MQNWWGEKQAGWFSGEKIPFVLQAKIGLEWELFQNSDLLSQQEQLCKEIEQSIGLVLKGKHDAKTKAQFVLDLLCNGLYVQESTNGGPSCQHMGSSDIGEIRNSNHLSCP